MKKRRLFALIQAIVLAFSALAGPLPAYAEPDGTDLPQEPDSSLCAHHTAHDDSCGYKEGEEGSPCIHVCSTESGCVVVKCIHTHNDSCGYIEGNEDSCNHVCSEETGCITVKCVHEHNDSCGYQAAVPAQPCQYLCPICDCICTSLCEEEAFNDDCPVCSQDPSNCTFSAVEFRLAFESEYAEVDQPATLTLTGSITGQKVTGATVQISLTSEEAAMLSLSGADSALASLKDNVLTVSLSKDAPLSLSLSVSSAAAATMDISKEDISFQVEPADYQNSPLVSVSLYGDQLTFVEKLPTEQEYGSGTTYQSQVDDLTVLYVDQAGAAAPRQETSPTFTLYYQVGEDEPRPLTEDALPFGMTEAPQVLTTPGEDRWTASLGQEDMAKLPSSVLALEGGDLTEKAVSWYLLPSYPTDYYPNAGSLVEITDDNAADYPEGLGRGWYFIGGQEPYPDDTVTVEDFLGELTHKVYWADNGNAGNKRPDNLDGLYELQYAFDGSSSYTALTEDNLEELGLQALPQPLIEKESGIWELTWEDSLPSKITYADNIGGSGSITRDVNWRVVFRPELTGYAMVEITPENADDYSSVQDQYGTHYVLETDLTFHVRIYRGGTSQGESLREAFLEQFTLDAQYTGDNHQYYVLKEVEEDGHLSSDSQENPDAFSITITHLWRYNLDNTRINYSIQEYSDPIDNRLDHITALDEGDYFAISYDNSAVPSFSDITDAVYGGGTLKLTLTGTVSYRAYKVWLDDGTTQRPDVELELWRYRSGQPYTTASLVRNDDGSPYLLNLNDCKLDAQGRYEIVFDEDLPKYDPEGYRYRYVVREYLSGANAGLYEQVFGSVAANGSVQDTLPEYTPRDANDTFLYNGGTLSNRLRGTVAVPVTKDWKAASFQSEFEDVMVVMRLQSRYKGSGDGWQDTEYTCQLMNFLAENLTASHTGSYPRYDAFGRELEYRWVEEEVWQGGTVEGDAYVGGHKVDSTVAADGSRTFTLEQNGRQVLYHSESDASTGEEGTRITNSIANTVEYQVIKEFDPAWDPALYDDSYTFSLFRSTSGSNLVRYATFTVDRDTRNDPPTIRNHVSDNASLSIQQTGEWEVIISGLPEFDTDGQQYEYLLLEENGSPLQMDTKRDQEGNYITKVYNGTGPGNRILVRKEWIDESDAQHRLPVEITVYSRADNQEIKTATLGTDIWYGLVGIGQYEPEEVYILETKVGETQVGSGQPQQPVYTDSTEQEPTTVQFRTQYHNYEATYSYIADFGASSSEGDALEGVHCYTVTNRRLGNINLTVQKEWVDGDGDQRLALSNALEDAGLELAVQLDFYTAPSLGLEKIYVISRDGYSNESGDTVTISRGNPTPILDKQDQPVDSIQVLDLAQKEQTLYFYNLPKYDGNGASVRYTVDEVFVDSTGKTYTAAELEEKFPNVAEAYRDYRLSITAGDYVVGLNHALDTQEFTLTNRLSATTDVSWYALWQDEFAYTSGSRPDIYLNIYSRTHTLDGEGKVTTQTDVYVRNYRWVYEEDEDDQAVDERNFWKCTLEGLPKYDALGYEIDYFAVMHSSVSTSEFDYLDTAYAPGRATDDGNVFATAAGPTGTSGGNTDQLQDVSGDASAPSFALQSGNTFVNTLYDTITYSGEKLWANLPDSYPLVDLPTVTFTLSRSVGQDPSEEVATMTIAGSQWEKLNESGHYVFEFGYTGENEPTSQFDPNALPQGAELLPRFDGSGRLYTYTLTEEIDWEGTDAGNANEGNSIFDISQTGQTLTNSYQISGPGQLSARKYLTVPADQKVYPAIRLTLSRTYTTNAGRISEPETVSVQVWDAEDVRSAVEGQMPDSNGNVTVQHDFTFTGLPLYAPNGSLYQYTITEDKDQLGGFDTWAGEGDLDASALESDTNGSYKGQTSVEGLTASENPDIDASFLNKPEESPAPIRLTGAKQWDDLGDAFGFRPEIEQGLTLKLERRASAQLGQDNAIGWENVTIDGTAVKIKWDESSDPNRWTYTITGLDRYAPNGMPWIYQVIETPPANYTASKGTAAGTSGDDGNITMGNLSNTILTNTYFKKEWVDSDGQTITQNLLGKDIELEVSYALQVRSKPTTPTTGTDPAWSDWEEAGRFFSEKLAPDHLSGLQNHTYTGSIRASLGDDEAWDKSYRGKDNIFLSLPRFIISADGTTYSLEYRVVETGLTVWRGSDSLFFQTYSAPPDNGDGEYAYQVSSSNNTELFAPYYGENADAQPNGTKIHKNQLNTTQLIVTKIWEDNGDFYSLRPDSTSSRYDWEVTFLIQRSTDKGVSWETAPGLGSVTLYGSSNQDSVSKTLDGLPQYAFDSDGNLVDCRYRVRELPVQNGTGSGASQIPLEEGDSFGGSYTVDYNSENGLTVTNRLQTTDFQAKKDWNDEESTHPSVTLELKYLAEGGDEDDPADYLPLTPAATVQLGKGKADATSTKPFYAKEDWLAVWKDVPLILPSGSELDDNNHTIYSIFETVTGDYLVEKEADDNSFTFTNTPSVTPSVTKNWLGVTPASSVQVTLYRNTAQAATPEEVAQATLNAAGKWTHTFDPQPQYDSGGNAYTYWVEETQIDGKPAAEAAQAGNFAISYGGDAANGFQVYNHKLDELYVIKDWADAASPESRPKDLTLTLQRTDVSSPAESDWETVNASYTWTKNEDDNQWTTVFSGLPLYNTATGARYTYRVTETVPDGYSQTILNDKDFIFRFRNTLSDTVDIPVRKLWADSNDNLGYRPDSVTLVLYQNGIPTQRTLTLSPSSLFSLWNSLTGGNAGWEGVFEDLPKYDENGALYTYTVVETPALSHYEVSYGQEPDGTLTVTNTATGQLTISKQVTGGGDPEQFFHFEVQLSDASLYGQYGEITFEEGRALIALRAGESLTASDLPAGIGYTVKEAEADQGPYLTQSSGESGTIQAGQTALASFTNQRLTTQISVNKEWDDGRDKEGLRPQGVTIRLLANGRDTGKTLELTPQTDWKGNFTDLDAYENGAEITYTVEEVPVEGYSAQIRGNAAEGFVITNIHRIPVSPSPTPSPAEPTGSGPATGDSSCLWLWAALAAAGLLVLGVSTLLKRRTNKRPPRRSS